MKYKLILADPPWAYRNKKTGGSLKSGSAQKYKVMELRDICELPVGNIADKDCVLFLWATAPLLPEALKVMGAWGFKYKSILVWRKVMSLGLGYWFRGQVEFLLLGVRGKVKAFRCQRANWIQTKVRAHSQKPEEFYEMIESLGIGPKVELFASEEREGWDCIGDKISGGDIKTELNRLTKLKEV